jgi:hypothetical protein
MIIRSKCNKSNQVLAYTYMLYFLIDDIVIHYYGVRYGNIRLGISPAEDIFKEYFTSSSSVNALLENKIYPFKIVIHKTFLNTKDACEYEVKFLTKIDAKGRKDFLNQTNTFNNSLPNNLGRKLTDKAKAAISKGSSKSQSNAEYRKYRSDLMKRKWSDPTFAEKMKLANSLYKETGKSKEAGAKSGNSRIGLKYSADVKSKRSEALKKACEKIDMKSRAINRKRYECPICNLLNLDGGNFNNHMKSRHNWSKDESSIFKSMN